MVIESLIGSLSPYLRRLSILVGGVFGLYLILILVRVYYERKKVRILQDIRYDLDRMNESRGLPVSHSRPTLWAGLMKKCSASKPRKKKR